MTVDDASNATAPIAGTSSGELGGDPGLARAAAMTSLGERLRRRRHGAAADSAGRPSFLELDQVPADGHLADPERVGCRADRDRAVRGEPLGSHRSRSSAAIVPWTAGHPAAPIPAPPGSGGRLTVVFVPVIVPTF